MPSARRICGSSSTTSTRLIDSSTASADSIDHRETAAGGVLDGQLTAHRLDEAPGDREPESDAGPRRRLVAEPLERLEDPVALIGWDAGAAVDHPNVDALGNAAGLDPNRVLGRGPGDRVVDDVRQGTFEERGIGVDAR